MNNTQEIGNSVLQDFEDRILEYFDSAPREGPGSSERSMIEYLFLPIVGMQDALMSIDPSRIECSLNIIQI